MTSQARIDLGHWWDRALYLVQGCFPVNSGCLNCWAAGMAHRFHQARGLTNPDGTWNGKVYFDGNVLQKLKEPHKPCTWAVWNDLFHCDVSWRDLYYALSIMQESVHDTFIILTKRPSLMMESVHKFLHDQYSPLGSLLSPHIQLGISASDQQELDDSIIPLFKTPAEVKILSLEPLLGPIDIMRHIDAPLVRTDGGEMAIPSIQGVIVGGETGRNPRPMDTDWARSIRDQCQSMNIPFFFKQQGGRGKKNRVLDGRVWDELPGRTA